MINLRSIFNTLPTFIVGLYFLCFLFFSYFDFYKSIYKIIETIEVPLYLLIAIDFIFNSKKYTLLAKRSIVTIVCQCVLYYYTEIINTEIYYTIYGLLLITWLISISTLYYKWKK